MAKSATTCAMIDRRQMLVRLSAAAALPFAARAADVPSMADLKGDVAILREALTLHPGLYRYSTPAQIDARLAHFETGFFEAPDLETRYLLLSRFLATIRCGHSYCNFFNQKKAVAAPLFDRKTRLPFGFRWIAGAMVVIDHGGDNLPRGSEVLAINGVAPCDMLTRLLPFARADGHSDAKRVPLLEVRGTDEIEYFDVFHGLTFGAPPNGPFAVVQRPAGLGQHGYTVRAHGPVPDRNVTR